MFLLEDWSSVVIEEHVCCQRLLQVISIGVLARLLLILFLLFFLWLVPHGSVSTEAAQFDRILLSLVA